MDNRCAHELVDIVAVRSATASATHPGLASNHLGGRREPIQTLRLSSRLETGVMVGKGTRRVLQR
jgi:hypothetical protein